MNKDLRNRSSLGAMFVNRTGTGEPRRHDNYNRTYRRGRQARDLREAVTISGFAATHADAGADGTRVRYSSAFEFQNARRTRRRSSYAEVGENFNPEVGFLERPDGYRQVSTALRRHIRTPALAKLGLREFEPHASYESYWGFDGLQETATLHIDGRWDFENGYTLDVDGAERAVRRAARAVRGLPGRRRAGRQLSQPVFPWPVPTPIGASGSRPALSVNIGGFLSGNQVSLAPTLNIRQGGRLTSSLRWTRNDIDSAAGRVRDEPGEPRG